MWKCIKCTYTIKTPPIPRTCPQCGEVMGIRQVELKDVTVRK